MQTSRAPAISVSAESCIPAGLRLGPVPGIFKLGKYLSDRREPGPKKKVFSYGPSCTAGPCFSVDSGEAGLGEEAALRPSLFDPPFLERARKRKGSVSRDVSSRLCQESLPARALSPSSPAPEPR